MKTRLALIALFLGFFASGCGTLFDQGPEFTYPNGNKAFWEAARKSALDGIASVDGKRPKLKKDERCESVPGQRKYSGCWCWFSPEWNFWVAGLCHLTDPIRPQAGCNPKTGGEMHPGVAQHEVGHAIRWDTSRDATHNPKYRNVLWSWSGPDSKSTMTRRLYATGSEFFVVDGFPVDAEHPAPTLGGVDAAALLQQAITLQQSALTRSQEALDALGSGPSTEPDAQPSGQADLSTFKCKDSVVLADPAGWPTKRRATGDAYGAFNVQWTTADGAILHAKVPKTGYTTGLGAAWYHFTPGQGKTPDPRLTSYNWVDCGWSSDSSGNWRKWRKR